MGRRLVGVEVRVQVNTTRSEVLQLESCILPKFDAIVQVPLVHRFGGQRIRYGICRDICARSAGDWKRTCARGWVAKSVVWIGCSLSSSCRAAVDNGRSKREV